MTNETTQDSNEVSIQYIEEVQPTRLSSEQLFEKLCNRHREINTLNEDVKQLMQDGKEKELDVVMINNIAKAYVKDKVDEMQDKAEATISLINNLVNN